MAQRQVDEGSDPEAVELAEEVVAAQQAEVDEMTRLLADM
jgi:uncharacterized protein (DUF305 family)